MHNRLERGKTLKTSAEGLKKKAKATTTSSNIRYECVYVQLSSHLSDMLCRFKVDNTGAWEEVVSGITQCRKT